MLSMLCSCQSGWNRRYITDVRTSLENKVQHLAYTTLSDETFNAYGVGAAAAGHDEDSAGWF